MTRHRLSSGQLVYRPADEAILRVIATDPEAGVLLDDGAWTPRDTVEDPLRSGRLRDIQRIEARAEHSTSIHERDFEAAFPGLRPAQGSAEPTDAATWPLLLLFAFWAVAWVLLACIRATL